MGYADVKKGILVSQKQGFFFIVCFFEYTFVQVFIKPHKTRERFFCTLSKIFKCIVFLKSKY